MAKTHVEKVLCSGGNSGMGDLDQTMHDLYLAVRKSQGADTKALSTSQHEWLEKRNQYKGTDDDMMSCLYDSYRKRYKEFSKPMINKSLPDYSPINRAYWIAFYSPMASYP